MNINKVILMGRLTHDVELKTTNSGTEVCQFSVAVNRRTKEGEAADFIDCVAFGKRATFLEKYFRKGSAIIVLGNINTEMFTDKNGNKRKSVKVIADEIQFGSAKGEAGGDLKQTAAPLPPDIEDMFEDIPPLPF